MTRKQKSKNGKGRRSVAREQRGAESINNRIVSVGPAVPRSNYLKSYVGGLPQSTRRTLVWSVLIGQTTTVGSYTEAAVVILNSPFDPDAALGGVSATGFAKNMAFYSKCFTLGARIKFKGAVGSTQFAGTNLALTSNGITITTSSTSLGGVLPAINAGLVDYGVNNISPDSFLREMSVDIGKFLDKPDVLDDPQLFCTAAANPGQVVVAHVWVHDFSGTQTTVYGGLLEVEYDCIFTDPIPFT